jgi:hypothetical protein
MNPTDTAASAEVVSPTELFELATTHLGRALEQIGTEDDATAPDSVLALTAAGEAFAGMRILQAAMVPTTPFQQRERALQALGDVQAGVDLLDAYAGQVRDFGPGPLSTFDVPAESLHLLVTARRRVASAVARIS